MACKTYKELAKTIKPVIEGETQEDIDAAIKEVLEMDYYERVDAYESTKGWLVDALNDANPRIDGKAPVTILDIRENGEGYKVTYRYNNGTKPYTMNVGEYGGLFTFDDGVSFHGNAREIKELYSDREFLNEGTTGYEKRNIDMLNEPGKIVELGEELADIGYTELWHKHELMANLRTIAGTMKEAMPKIAVYINKNASRTGGAIKLNPKKSHIRIGVSETDTRKTPLEAYVHELYHAVTYFAIESKDANISRTMRRLNEVHEHFMDNMSVEKFMRENEGLSRKTAEEILDYFNDKNVGVHEFTAYAMTNKYVMNSLSKMKIEKEKEVHNDWASKLVAYVRELFKNLTNKLSKEPKDANGYETMAFLVNELAAVNNRANEAKREHILERFLEPFLKVEGRLKDYAKIPAKKLENMDLGKTNDTYFGAAKVYTKAIAQSFVNERTKRLLEQQLSFFGMAPEGTVQTVLRDMSESDNFADAVEKLGLVGQNIDQQREFIFGSMVVNLKEAFDKELSTEEMEALTSFVLDTDISTVYADYDRTRLTDKKYIRNQIKSLESELASKVDAVDLEYYKVQAEGLGYYMVTGLGNTYQLQNAHNIAKKINSVRRDDNVSEEIITIIDKLATFQALRYTDKSDLDIIAGLIASDELNGIDTMVAYQQGHKDKVEKSLFDLDSDKYKVIKGYSKEIFDRDVDVKVKRLSDKRKMEGQGYKLVREFSRENVLGDIEPLGLYISTAHSVQDLHRVALRYTDKGMRGTSLYQRRMIEGDDKDVDKAEIIDRARTDVEKVKTKMIADIAKIHKGEKGFTKPKESLIATFDNEGRVTDYRFIMSKYDKKRLLKMDRRGINVLSRMYASTYDKEMTPKFNDIVMKTVIDDMEKNYDPKSIIGRNQKEYIEIKPNSGNAEVDDLWSILPSNIKKDYPKGFPVRRDMMHSILGFRDVSVTDVWGIRHLPVAAKHAVRVAESVWKEVIKVAKVDIILRMPTVLIGNITSNFMYSVMTGHSPIDIVKLQLQGVRELNDFISKTQKIVALEAKITAGLATKAEISKVKRLKGAIEKSPVKELIDEGFYTTIIEELGADEFGTSNKLTEFVDDKLKDYGIIKDTVHWLYLSERTPVFKAMNMATQYSDFVARYAQYHLMINKGVSKSKAAKTVRDAFINYNKPNSRVVEWANQMGLIMFTKYFTRIQKAIKAGVTDHPLKILMALIGQEWVTGDVEDITDQSLVTKDLGVIVHGPMDSLMRVINPSAVEAALEVIQS